MEQVEVGLMLPGGELFDDKNVNPTWRAPVRTHTDVVTAFVKLISPRKLYIECICAIIGRHLGLPIPKPLIIKVTNECVDDVPEGSYKLAYGSEDAAYPSFRRYAESQAALDKLKNFSKSLDIGVFDEWIANYDRNVGNILYDGGESFTFIDHENAIPEGLPHDQPAHDNNIIRALFSLESEFEKFKSKRTAETDIIPQYTETPFSILAAKTYATNYLDESQITEIVSFLETRIDQLGELLRARLNIKQQGMAL